MKLYILKIPKELEREEYIRLYENIDETKQRKIMNFRMSEDRIRGLLADNLVRHLAHEYLGLKGDEIRYTYSKNGKPSISGAPNFCFNISHSGEYVICAVSKQSIGCDIQYKKPCDIRMGRYIFTPEEMSLVHNSDDFYRMWTLKEALLKAIGIGICGDGIKINMVRSSTISDITYKDQNYYSKNIEKLLDDYSISLWSMDNSDCEIVNIDYKTFFNSIS